MQAHRPDATEGPWQFRDTADCPVVYHLVEQAPVRVDEVIAQVAAKALDKPEPVCFCFAHTSGSLGAELAETGASSAKAQIKAAVAEGYCACEYLNPSGECCLPVVHRTLRGLHQAAPTL